MFAIIGSSYGLAIRALPLTGGGVAFAVAALGRTHAFIAGWALTLGYSCVVALNASAVTLVFRVTFPELVMQGTLYDVAGWASYLPEVAICSLFIILFAWLNTKGAALFRTVPVLCSRALDCGSGGHRGVDGDLLHR